MRLATPIVVGLNVLLLLSMLPRFCESPRFVSYVLIDVWFVFIERGVKVGFLFTLRLAKAFDMKLQTADSSIA